MSPTADVQELRRLAEAGGPVSFAGPGNTCDAAAILQLLDELADLRKRLEGTDYYAGDAADPVNLRRVADGWHASPALASAMARELALARKVVEAAERELDGADVWEITTALAAYRAAYPTKEAK